MSIKRTIRILSILIISGVIIMTLFSGCGNAKYRIDYSGQKSQYSNARDSYRAGSSVKLYFNLIATDTDYSFFLDGERISPLYEEGHGYVIEFTMPEHDVTLKIESRNSMEYIPETEPGVILIDYCRKDEAVEEGGSFYEIVLYSSDDDTDRLSVYRSIDDDKGTGYLVPHEASELCYDIIYGNDIGSWNSMEEYVSLDGAVTSCKYREGGDYIRVSTDHMPENGENVLMQIEKLLSGYMVDEYLDK